MSTLELRWTDRVLTGSQMPRRFLDFVVDGQPLYQMMGDRISPLGWLEDDENERAVSRLLRKAEPDAHDGRFSIYVCPECADINCGAVTAVIDRVGDNIVWRDFGFETNYDDTIVRDGLEAVGPFTFNATEYYDVIGSALEKPA